MGKLEGRVENLYFALFFYLQCLENMVYAFSLDDYYYIYYNHEQMFMII